MLTLQPSLSFRIPIPTLQEQPSFSEKPVRDVDGQEDLTQMDGWMVDDQSDVCTCRDLVLCVEACKRHN